MRALTAATRLHRRGRPWPTLARAMASIAAGTLDANALREHTARAWEITPADTVDYELMASERAMLTHVAPPPARILVIGSGAGRDLVAYAALGFEVTGIEPAPLAARASQQALSSRGLPGTVINAFAEDAALDGRFDTIVFSYFCYGYIPEHARRVALLRRLRDHLAANGMVAISYNPPHPYSMPRLMRLGAWLSGAGRRSHDRDFVALTGRADAPFAVEHLFADDDVVAEAQGAGYDATSLGAVGEVRLALLKARSAAI